MLNYHSKIDSLSIGVMVVVCLVTVYI